MTEQMNDMEAPGIAELKVTEYFFPRLAFDNDI
jgi:hypothetical protein